MMASRQFSSGALRRMKLRGIAVWQTYLVKILVSLAFSEALALVSFAVFAGLGWQVSLLKLMAGASVVAVSVQAICLAFALPAGSSRTALGSFAALLFLLFAGGGFYPTYLMSFSIQRINPAFLAHLVSEWALGQDFPWGVQSLWILLLPSLCAVFSLWKWGRQT
jgi:hypothetical protein